jgi:hypothetical protein
MNESALSPWKLFYVFPQSLDCGNAAVVTAGLRAVCDKRKQISTSQPRISMVSENSC